MVITPITPDTKVHLLSGVPLDKKYEHSFYGLWADVTAQSNFFINNYGVDSDVITPIKSINDSVRYPANAEDIQGCNYMVYKNKSKWYFAFITGTTYVNPGTTEIQFDIDPVMTYYFDYSFKPSFVDREHGDPEHPTTIEEDLAVGEYVVRSKQLITEFIPQAALVGYSRDPAYTGESHIIGGVYSDLNMFAYDLSHSGIEDSIAAAINNLTDQSLTLMYISNVPACFFTFDSNGKAYVNNPTYSNDFAWNKPTTLDGYTPKNKKLLQYPYSICRVYNGAGNSLDLKPERFSSLTQFTFRAQGVLGANTAIALIPTNYKDVALNVQESIVLSNFPQSPTVSDSYQAYMAQNKNSMAIGGLTSLLAITTGAVTGNVAAVGGGLLGIAGTIGKYADLQNKPNNVSGSINTADVNTAFSRNTFEVDILTCDAYHAKTIDDFLWMFGEKTLQLKIPNRDTMTHWNYVKTQSCNITGDIPYAMIEQIKNIYNNGITLWHTTDVGNYALANALV